MKERKPASTMTGLPARRVNAPARRLTPQVQARLAPQVQAPAIQTPVPAVSVVVRGNAILTGVARLCTMGRAHDQHITTAHMLLRLSMQVNAQNQQQLQPLNQHVPQRLQQRLLHHLLRPRRARGTAKP